MAIAETITSMYTNVGNAYNVLTLAGANLTSVNKNLVNLTPTWKERLLYFMNNGTDEVWNNWDKVNGTGTTLSLNNTVEAPMRMEYKGNTSQFSTTGKNLYNALKSYSWQQSSTASWKFIDGSSGASGTDIGTKTLLKAPVESGKTYTFTASVSASASVVSQLVYGDETLIKRIDGATATFSETFASAQDGYVLLRLYMGANVSVSISNVMLRISTASADYEPYTGGKASPNPDYPQEVKVVKGDNKIKITGKNLVCGKIAGYYVNASGGFSSGAYDMQIAKVIQGNTYIVSTDQSGLVAGFFTEYPTTSSTTYNSSRIVETNKVFIAPITGYIAFRTGNDYEYAQLEKGSTATSYEPYKGANYPINLPVENILNLPSHNSHTFSANTNGYAYSPGIQVQLKANTKYYISYNVTASSTSIRNTPMLISPTSQYSYEKIQENYNQTAGRKVWKYTPTETGTFQFNYWCNTPNVDITVSDFMITTSPSKTYWAYGTTPIELCKIGNYQDSFIRNTGKNLFDSSQAQIGKAWNNASNTARAIVLTKVNPNTKYTISFKNISGLDGIYWFDRVNETDSTYITGNTQITQTTTITTAPTCNWLGIQFNKTSISQTDIDKVMIQIEKGNTATDYEPYGKGDWYKKETIKKIVID